MNDIKTIIIDDETEIRSSTRQFLELSDIACEDYSSAIEFLPHLSRELPAVIISDIRMPRMDGLELLKSVMAVDTQIPVILITGHGDVQMAVSALQNGAYDFIEKPFNPDELLAQVERASEARRLTLDNRALRHELGDMNRLKSIIVGASPASDYIREQILELSQCEDHILICGEFGTGRSLAARAINAGSALTTKPLQSFNCSAYEEAELEERLFDGMNPPALLTSTTASTLILKEIDSLSPRLQNRLLNEFLKSDDEQAPNIRIIAIANTENGISDELRNHLYAKSLHLPPLRERGEDVLLIFEKYYNHYCTEYGKDVEPLSSDDAAMILSAYWAGNIRQVIQFSERFAMCESKEQEEKLMNELFGEDERQGFASKGPLKSQVEAFETLLIRNALIRHNGQIAPVLEELAIPRRTLNEKMARYNLSRTDFTKNSRHQ